MAAFERRKKLSLKRKTNADFNRDDGTVSSIYMCETRKTTDNGSDINGEQLNVEVGLAQSSSCRTPTANPVENNPELSRKTRSPSTRNASMIPARKSQPLLNRTSLTSRHSYDQEWTRLPDLPAWFGLKDKEEEETPKGEIIKIGNVSIEWIPLPKHCHLCLVRTKHKRAAELPQPSGSTQGQHDLNTFDLVQSSGQGIQKASFVSRPASYHRSVPSRNEKRNNLPKEPIENVNPEREILKKEVRPVISSQANIITNSKFHSSSHSKTVVQDVPLASRLSRTNNSPKTITDPKIKTIKEKRDLKKFHLVQKGAHNAQTNSQKSNQHVSKTALSNKSLSSRCEKGADTPIELIEDFNWEHGPVVHSETSADYESRCIKGRGDLMNLDPMRNSTHNVKAANQKSDLRSLSTESCGRDLSSTKGTRNDVQKLLIEEFDNEIQILNRKPRPESNNGSYFKKNMHQQPSTSTKKLLHSSKTKSGTENRASNISSNIITKHFKKCELPANTNKLTNSCEMLCDNSSRRPSATTSSQPCKNSQIRMTSVTPPTSHRQETQDLNNSSPEIIILDSDDDDEIFPPSPIVLHSSYTSSKRKLSGTETDETAVKKPKFMDLAATTSGTLTTRLTPEPEIHSASNSKTAQSKLIWTQDRKINPARSTQVKHSQQQSSNLSPVSGVPNKQCLDQSQMTASTSKSVGHSPDILRKFIKISQSNFSKPGTANKDFNKLGFSDLGKHSNPTALNLAIKKNSHISSNLSSTVRPLFKKQPETSMAETSKNAQQAHKTLKANLPYRQTQSQKVLPKQSAFIPINRNDGNIAGDYRQQGATTTTGRHQFDQNPFSKHPLYRKTLEPNQMVGELSKQSKDPATVNQWTNKGLPSGFQTAGDIRTSKMDSGTNQASYPKRDINIANSSNIHKDTNHGSSGTRFSYKYMNQDQHTNWGIKQDQHANRDIKQNDIIQNCPLCQLQFNEGWTLFQRDNHIAVCLSQSAEDITW